MNNGSRFLGLDSFRIEMSKKNLLRKYTRLDVFYQKQAQTDHRGGPIETDRQAHRMTDGKKERQEKKCVKLVYVIVHALNYSRISKQKFGLIKLHFECFKAAK